LKKLPLILLTLLVLAAGITVGCGNNSAPTFTKMPFASDRTVSPTTPLFLMNLDGSSVTPVAASLTNIYSPSISADFKTVAFTSSGNIWVSSADGATQTQLTSDGNTYYAKLSPDGKKIVYGLWNNSNYEFWVMSADGTGNLNLTSTMPDGMLGCYSGSFSADSSKIAFACYGNSTYGLYLVKPDGTGTATVTTQSGFVDVPMFTPNGKQILFATWPGPTAKRRPGFNQAHSAAHSHAAPSSLSGQGIASINLDGSNATLLVTNAYEAEILNSTLYYTFYSSDLGLYQIYKSNLDGTNAASISDGTADDYLYLSSD